MIIAIMLLHILEAVCQRVCVGDFSKSKCLWGKMSEWSSSYCTKKQTRCWLEWHVHRLQGTNPKVEMQISSLTQRDFKQPLEWRGKKKKKAIRLVITVSTELCKNEKSVFQQQHKELNPYLSFSCPPIIHCPSESLAFVSRPAAHVQLVFHPKRGLQMWMYSSLIS